MTIPTGGVSYYPFDEGSGTTLGDDWGSNDGTINGATWSSTVPSYATSGSPDYSLSFDGTNDYVSSSWSSVPQDLSISLWVKTETTDLCALFGQTNDNNRVTLRANEDSTDGKFRFRLLQGGSEKHRAFFTNTDWNDGNWHNIVIISNGTNGLVTAYFDNVSQSITDAYENTHTSYSMTNPWFIGALRDDNTDTGTNFFDGLISNLQVFDTVLTTTQISNLYNYGNVDGGGTTTYNPVFFGMNF